MEVSKTHLEVLSEDAQGYVNYDSWRFKIDLTLQTQEIFEIATGTSLKPAGPDTDAAVKAWNKKDLQARHIIGLNVDKHIALKIAHCKTAQQMLDKLVTLYGTKTDVNIELLQRKFFSFVYNENKSVVENVMELCDLDDQLEAEDEPVEEKWLMTRILNALPSRLAHFRTAWDNVSGTKRTVGNMIIRLRLEDERLREDESHSDHTTQNAMIAKHKKKPAQQQQHRQQDKSKERSKVICYRCDQPGHVRSGCHNKPCAKYLAYCKTNYACNKCRKKGHFAKECTSREEQNDQDGGHQDGRQIRRACISIGLSSIQMAGQSTKSDRRNVWYQDCGASQHMTFHKEWFTTLVQLEQPTTISMGNSHLIEGVGVGDINLEAFDGRKWNPIVLKDALYVPDLNYNLFSVGQTLKKGYIQEADQTTSRFIIPETGETFLIADMKDNLFEMKIRREGQNTCLAAVSLKTWHERLAHQNVRYVKEVLDRKGIKYIDDWKDYVCKGCVYGKQHRNPHPIDDKVATEILEMVHVDLGEIDVRSLGGAKYFLLFKDDYSHFRTVYFLKTKDEAASKLDLYVKMVENQFGKKVKILKSDNGLEIKNKDTRALLQDLGVFHIFTNTHTPQQNGRIEREMRTIVEAARSEIHANNLNKNLWAEAILYSVFTINQTGKSSVKDKTPAELWFGRQMDPNKLRAFGTECYILTPDYKRGKMDRKSERGIFVGYDLDSPCYRIYNAKTSKIISTDNVIFDEVKNEGIQMELKNVNEAESEEPEVLKEESQPEEPEKRQLRDRSTLKQPERYDAQLLGYIRGKENEKAMIGEIEDIPVREALKDPDWRKAMEEEYDSLVKMQSWTLVECPEDVKPLTCRWVLKEKADGRLKARLVVRGFEQKEGIDYSETFSPVAKHPSIRLLLSHAASEKLNVITFDVKTAFLHAGLEEVIHMNQAEGFDDGSGKVCRLDKSVYGLKQAPRMWNEEATEHMNSIGFTSTDDDPCIFYNHDKSIMMSLFVDDGLIIGKDRDAILKVLEEINNKFEITYDKKFTNEFTYLGMELKVKPDGISVNQSRYTRKILNRFNLADCNPAPTPIEKGMVTDSENLLNDTPVSPDVPYREAIGSLLYLSTISRPDISFAVNYLSRYCSKPKLSHWKMVKRVFQYLKGTEEFGIFFNGDKLLVAYTDSDFGGDAETSRSTSGVIILRGGPLVWYSQKQHLVSTSTSEAEYRAAVSSIDDISWIKRICLELGILRDNQPIPLFIDNQSAIHMLKSTCDGKTMKGKKHIEIPRKFICEHVDKTVTLVKIRSNEQLADILTKPLCKCNFVNNRRKIIKEEC